MCKALPGVPKETLKTLFIVCKIACYGFFDWCTGDQLDDPKIIFTVADLKECGVEVKDDGYGLLKATHTHQLITDTVAYSFSHLTIQEFLCAVYVSTLSQEEQQHLLRKQCVVNSRFEDKGSSMLLLFLFGLTGLSSEVFQLVCTRLSESENSPLAMMFMYESQLTNLPQAAAPIRLKLQHLFLPYCILYISHILSYCPISELSLDTCFIGDRESEVLVMHYLKNPTAKSLEVLSVFNNDFTN